MKAATIAGGLLTFFIGALLLFVIAGGKDATIAPAASLCGAFAAAIIATLSHRRTPNARNDWTSKTTIGIACAAAAILFYAIIHIGFGPSKIMFIQLGLPVTATGTFCLAVLVFEDAWIRLDRFM